MDNLKIGNIEMKNQVVLAPMAGVCNPAFRLIAKEFGTGLVCAEMVSGKAIVHGNKRTQEMLFVDEREKPLSLQILVVTANLWCKRPKWSISKPMPTSSTLTWAPCTEGNQDGCGCTLASGFEQNL